MGLLDFNVGELASRIIRGGGSRGRVPLTLDDQVLPMVRVGDWSRAPYRLDERKFFNAGIMLANIAQFSNAAIKNASKFPIIIERLEFGAVAAGVVTFSDQIGQSGSTGGSVFGSAEGNLPISGTTFNLLPGVTLELPAPGVAALPPGVALRSSINLAGTGAPVPLIWDDCDLLIPPGFAYQVQALTANVAFSIGARIRAPQQLPPGS